MISLAFWAGRCARISAIVCGCSSWMNVSRFSLSAFCKNEKGVVATCWVTCLIAFSASASDRLLRSSALAYSRPPSLM